ncbi:uncharacterized GPI-anchored protein At3g06035-like [Carya illinoinensis]|uniref:Uncharacterized GPI-anchored protein At5g19230-like domain-containing protein n=1 Tax=Carya illinoinensis TaxID=32201 RepID=A0A922EGB3_CARIL|nr:uncharacterized GPI-anchored protein At3g06035-like [Carya illinoinensis]KAG6702101.1 hypothetical protein I3842_07G017300 [Carya illinoinensis]KAG6702102.1 hypothetical protein I3842_07G017300 [Carya illinoinensis]
MAAFLKLRLPIIILLILHGMPFLSHSDGCSDDSDQPTSSDNKEEKQLFRDINSYRLFVNLPVFIPNAKAACLADKISHQLQKDKPCLDAQSYRYTPGTKHPLNSTFKNVDRLLSHCHINFNTTADGAILPACVTKLDQINVLKNYRNSLYGRYLNDSKFTHAGIGSGDDWIVVILSTNTSTGSFSGAPVSLAPSLLGMVIASLFGCLLLINIVSV